MGHVPQYSSKTLIKEKKKMSLGFSGAQLGVIRVAPAGVDMNHRHHLKCLIKAPPLSQTNQVLRPCDEYFKETAT